MSFQIPPQVLGVTKTLQAGGYEAYLVGGCVRALLMGHTPQDWDLTTNALPSEVEGLFLKTFTNNPYGTVTVVNEEEKDPPLKNIEITTYRQETKYSDRRHPDEVKFSQKLEEDLKRRDYTINAIAYEPVKGQTVDPHNGQKDIKDKLLRAVGQAEERFEEDTLRILRGIRLTAQLELTLEQSTYEAMQKTARLLEFVSKERLRDEFTKIVNSPNPMVGLVLSQKLGILKYVAPELEQMLHVEQNKSHIYDVWEHSLRALQHAADKDYPFHVRLAALLHDIGKPQTRRLDKSKHDYTFYGHEVVGAKIAKSFMENLKYDKQTVSTVTKLVRNHMFFSDPEQITLSAVRRIIVKVGPDLIWDLMNLRTSDRIGMGRPKADPYRLRKYKSMIEEALRSPVAVTDLKISGQDVLRETSLEPGPKVGYILHALLEEVLEDPKLNTPDYLLKRVGDLAKLPETDLKNLGKSGKEKRAQAEEEELAEIRQKYWVK